MTRSTLPRSRLVFCVLSFASALGVSCNREGKDDAPSASPAPRPPSSAAVKATPPTSTPSATASTAAGTAASTAAGAAEGGACGMDGNWKAVGYACKGETRHAFPDFLSWTLAVNGADAPFKEQFSPPLPTCTGIEPWKASCTKSPAVLTLSPNGVHQCTPSNCLRAPRGKPKGACGEVPSAPLIWSIVEQTPSSLVLTSMEPFSLTTCTASRKSNPLTVWWQKL
jgi:hypothetical protein